MRTSKAKHKPFNKYDYYMEAVQSPEVDVEFLYDTYKSIRKKNPVTFREDFCGTFALSCQWVSHKAHTRAIGVDLDSEPLEYGRQNYLPILRDDQQKRIQIIQGNVLDPSLPKADIIGAYNFSSFFFKDRPTLMKYYRNCLGTLEEDGLFVMDAFGGPACCYPNEERTRRPGFIYFWEQESWDPITHHATFHIHFQRKGEKKRKKVFSYDWRMWTLPEIRDALTEAGFKKTLVYWEETDKKGNGLGTYKQAEHGELCEAWVAYVIGVK